jgi:thiol:disulfide interchange protein
MRIDFGTIKPDNKSSRINSAGLNPAYRLAWLPIRHALGTIIFVTIILGLIHPPALSQTSSPRLPALPVATATKAVALRTAWSVDLARPGDTFILAVVFNIKKGFHINADAAQIVPAADFNPIPTRVTVKEASEGLTIEVPRYPQARPAKVDFIEGDLMSFEGQTIVYLPMKFDGGGSAARLRIKLEIEYQACDAQICLFPQKIAVEDRLTVAAPDATAAAINQQLFAEYRQASEGASAGLVGFDLFGWRFALEAASWAGFALLLLVAAFGGMLLNFTPCVLPLVPIKIISLSKTAENKSRCLALGFTMFLGVLAFWLGLGAAIALVADFTATNQLFQYPAFTISVGIVIGLMAFGMCGLFSIRLPNFLYTIHPSQESLHGSFGLGILTAILSTPCTAPFMGAAAAWAATQHPLTTMTTFAAIGTGMALPYLVLSAFPNLIQKMPRSGPASVLIKEVMGLFMLAAAAYFIGTGLSGIFMQPPNPPAKLYWWAVMGFVAAGGLWMAYRTIRITSRKFLKTLFAALGILIFIGSAFGGLRLTDKGPIDWVYYTPQRFQTAMENRKVVVMIFTAEWCLNCKVLEQGVLTGEKITRLLAEDDIVPIKVDITGNNPWGKAKMKEIGNLTIPLLVIYSPQGAEVFRSDFYTAEQVLQAVKAARVQAQKDSAATGT